MVRMLRLRFALPVAITLVVGYALYRLDISGIQNQQA